MKLLDHEALKERGITFSRVHLWRMIKAGQFPAPVSLGPKRNAWVESEIDEWIKSRIAAREAA